MRSVTTFRFTPAASRSCGRSGLPPPAKNLQGRAIRLAIRSAATKSATVIGADGETPSNAAAIPTLTIGRWDGAGLAAPTVSIDGTDDGVYETTLVPAAKLDIINNLTSIPTARAHGRL